MSMRVLLPVLVAGVTAAPTGALALPAQDEPPVAAAGGPAIRSITVTPEAPVVGPTGTVRLVVEVVARGVVGPDTMTVQVEPGAPPGSGAEPDRGNDLEPGPGPEEGQIPVSPALTFAPAGRTAGPVPAVTGLPLLEREPGAAAGRAPHAGRSWETWRFRPDRKLSRWYPAGRWTVAATARGANGETVTGYAGFQLRRETRFSAVQAVRKGTEVEVRGVLNRVDPQGYLDYAPFPGQTVEILHRTGEEEKWTKTAEATTDLQGHFVQNVTGYQDGEWRARFTETGRYAAGRSRVHEAAPQ
ncbi:hypothetical protein ACQPYK_30840 [Streptosporangium sp. CA-135522]|uniref:hypothetical protein n=1 Tax=Streptosporangium sp. CA-135522 TaxID=3240072 RepID=UPI003D8AB5A5